MANWFKNFKDSDWRLQALRIVALLFGLVVWAFLSLPSVTYTATNPDVSFAYRAVDELFTGNFAFPAHNEMLVPAIWSVLGYVLCTIAGILAFVSNRRTGYLYSLIGSSLGFILIALQPVFTIRSFYAHNYADATNTFGLGYIMPLILVFLLVVITAYLYVMMRNEKKQTRD